MLFADIGSGDLFWSILWFFFLFIMIMILFQILGDLFRDHSLGGAAKAVWVLFLLVFPPLAMLIYLIVRGNGMAERAIAQQKAMQAQFNDYVKETAGTGSPADEIAQAKALLDAGTISADDFEKLKAKALS